VPPLVDRGLPEYAQLQAIVSKGLAPNRDDRYATAGAMARDLEDYVIRNRLRASPMKLGGFLTEQFETELVSVRRDLEQRALSVTAEVPVEVIPDLGSYDDDRAPLVTVPPPVVPQEIEPLALPSSGPPAAPEVVPAAVVPRRPAPTPLTGPPAAPKRPVAVLALAAVLVVGVLAFVASQLVH